MKITYKALKTSLDGNPPWRFTNSSSLNSSTMSKTGNKPQTLLEKVINAIKDFAKQASLK